MTLGEHLDRASVTTRETWDALVGPITISDTRSQLLLAYVSVALEHQEAIVLLARQALPASAFALVRPIFELLYRSAWMYFCAKPREVAKIKAGKFNFPPMRRW